MGRILRTCPLAFFIIFTGGARTALAEPYTILPNGDLVFNVSLSTNGVFTCGAVVSCIGSGTNTITLQSGAGTKTFSFTGLSDNIVLGNSTIPVTLGTFTGLTSPGFSLPDFNPNVALFSFGFGLSHTSPVSASDQLVWSFNQSFSRFGEGGRTWLQLPVGPQPPQYHYTAFIYTMRVFPLTLPGNGSQDLVSDAGVVPEPASLALVGTGLLAVLYPRRKRPRH
jgi:hypothetical protein